MTRIRVLLVDDHALMRSGIRALLERFDFIEVTGEAGNGAEAIAAVQAQPPEIVLMDIAMEQMSGLEAAARILQEFPSVKIIVLSMHANEEYVLQALRAGASGYLLKDAAVDELKLAIQAVSDGKTYLSPSISRQVIEKYLERVNDSDYSGPLARLTNRQRQVLRLIAEGKTTKEIAFQLQISVKTVETHRSQMMDRLGIHDIPGLVRYAMRAGLVPPEGA